MDELGWRSEAIECIRQDEYASQRGALLCWRMIESAKVGASDVPEAQRGRADAGASVGASKRTITLIERTIASELEHLDIRACRPAYRRAPPVHQYQCYIRCCCSDDYAAPKRCAAYLTRHCQCAFLAWRTAVLLHCSAMVEPYGVLSAAPALACSLQAPHVCRRAPSHAHWQHSPPFHQRGAALSSCTS